MKVIEWLDADEAKDKEESCGGMGGFFSEGMRWDDYLADISAQHILYIEAIRTSVIEHKLKIGGDGHQENWIPLFEDGTIGSFSFRAWGDLMAAIWSTEENKDYQYMDFYMNCLGEKD